MTTETSRETFYNKTCDQYFTPDSSEVKCYATFGTTVYLENGKGQVFPCNDVDGSCQAAQVKYMNGGCAPPADTTGENPPSGGGDPSSGSSTSADPTSSGSAEQAGIMPSDLEFIKDSFYMVDTNFLQVRSQLDYMGADVKHISGVADDMLNNSYTQNSLLREIANKNYNLNVNVPRDTIHNNVNVNVENPTYDDSGVTSRLDSILSKMGQGGNDTSGFGSILGQIDDIIAGIGNPIDSISLTWMSGLDTAGGKDVSSTIIGANGKQNALNSYKTTITSFGDSLANGAIGDSISAFEQGLKTNVLSGSGSESCPEVLTRKNQLEIAGNQAEVSFGTYICTPIINGMTPWHLGRSILRALVALACMWWLFRRATGTGSGEDE